MGNAKDLCCPLCGHPLLFDISRPGHPTAKFIILADDHEHVSRHLRRRLRRVAVSRDNGGRELRVVKRNKVGYLRAQAVPHDPDRVRSDIRKGFQKGNRACAAIGGIEPGIGRLARQAGVSASDCIDVQHHDPTAGGLD